MKQRKRLWLSNKKKEAKLVVYVTTQSFEKEDYRGATTPKNCYTNILFIGFIQNGLLSITFTRAMV